MPDRIKQLFDNEIHPLIKGAVGTGGGAVSWISGKLHLAQTQIEQGGTLAAIVKGIAFYGGAVVVLLTITSLSLDVVRKGIDAYRKWKNRNNS